MEVEFAIHLPFKYTKPSLGENDSCVQWVGRTSKLEICDFKITLCSNTKLLLCWLPLILSVLCASRPLHYVYGDRHEPPWHRGGREDSAGARLLFYMFFKIHDSR